MPASASGSGSSLPFQEDTYLLDPSNNLATLRLSKDEILSLQIQGFLDASDDVDLSQEVAQDLLNSLPRCNEDDGEGVTEDLPEVNPEGDDEGVEVNVYDGELDVSAVFDAYGRASKTWTKQELKHMLHHLKERGTRSFVAEYVIRRNIPIPKLLNAFGIDLSPGLLTKPAETMMYFLQVGMSFQLRMRDKLPQYNTITDAIELIRNSERIIILTGAGISVSCGIPDFRSRDGLYATLKDKGDYDLDDPQQMFDINYFRENPSVRHSLIASQCVKYSGPGATSSFASQIYPSNFVPSPCHQFIKAIEDHGKLLRNYTQNIDTLETLAGVKRVLQCHGSFASASCLLCRRRVIGSEIEADILKQKVPLCTVCNTTPALPAVKSKKKSKKVKKEWEGSESEDEQPRPDYPPGIMKPDITFFGEKLTDDFDNSLAEDREKVDLLLVIGTSLKVSPVAEILSHLPHSIPQILINKTPIRHINPDIVLLGNADDIILHLAKELDWGLPPPTTPQSNSTRLHLPRGNLRKRSSSDLRECQSPQRVGNSHVWLFEGAEGGKWLQDFQHGLANRNQPYTLTTSANSTRYSSPGGSPMHDVEERRESKKLRTE